MCGLTVVVDPSRRCCITATIIMIIRNGPCKQQRDLAAVEVLHPVFSFFCQWVEYGEGDLPGWSSSWWRSSSSSPSADHRLPLLLSLVSCLLVVRPGLHRVMVISVLAPPSTLRAVARSGRGGCWVVSSRLHRPGLLGLRRCCPSRYHPLLILVAVLVSLSSLSSSPSSWSTNDT
jgi:hypothetical protein